MDKLPWSRDQKIALSGVIISLLVPFLIFISGWFINNKLNYIIKNIKVTENAEIKSLTVEEFLQKCPPGTNTSTTEFIPDKGLIFKCGPKD